MKEEQELIFREGITFAFGSTHTFTLSKAEPVKAIVIKATMGGLTGGATGDYIPNTPIQSIKIRVNGNLMMEFDGLKNIDGQMSMGIATLREFYKQNHVVGMADDYFILEFPTSIPKNNEIQIIFETPATIAGIQTSGGNRTTLAGSTIDILYRTGNLSAKSIVPFISYSLYTHGARTGNLDEFVPPTNLPLRKLMMITYDGTTVSSTTYDSLTLTEGSKVLKEGSLAYLRAIQGSKSKVLQSTGHLHISFPKGHNVKSSTLKIQFRASTAGTTKFFHLAWLADK